jgi:hypothetical protein
MRRHVDGGDDKLVDVMTIVLPQMEKCAAAVGC